MVAILADKNFKCIFLNENSDSNFTEICSQESNWQLERLERLRSEDTPRRLMVTHSIESNWIPSQKKTKSKLQI